MKMQKKGVLLIGNNGIRYSITDLKKGIIIESTLNLLDYQDVINLDLILSVDETF